MSRAPRTRQSFSDQPTNYEGTSTSCWTLLFKKHRTTVLLLLPPSQTIEATKTNLLEALRARNLKEINGDPVPEDPTAIEFGVAVDKNDLEKGWTSLEAPKIEADDAPKRGPEKKATSLSLKAAELNNGQTIAFRFRKAGVASSDNVTDLDLEDPGWDVVIPNFDDEEEGS
ncbi:hypothetical protein BDV11DRAFT_168262 [Aspergillus similis]